MKSCWSLRILRRRGLVFSQRNSGEFAPFPARRPQTPGGDIQALDPGRQQTCSTGETRLAGHVAALVAACFRSWSRTPRPQFHYRRRIMPFKSDGRPSGTRAPPECPRISTLKLCGIPHLIQRMRSARSLPQKL